MVTPANHAMEDHVLVFYKVWVTLWRGDPSEGVVYGGDGVRGVGGSMMDLYMAWDKHIGGWCRVPPMQQCLDGVGRLVLPHRPLRLGASQATFP